MGGVWGGFGGEGAEEDDIDRILSEIHVRCGNRSFILETAEEILNACKKVLCLHLRPNNKQDPCLHLILSASHSHHLSPSYQEGLSLTRRSTEICSSTNRSPE